MISKKRKGNSLQFFYLTTKIQVSDYQINIVLVQKMPMFFVFMGL